MEKMITRTVKEHVIMCKVFDDATDSIKEITIRVPYSKNNTVANIVKAQRKNDVNVLKVITMEVSETLYGVSESEFMKIAKVLPARKVSDK